MREISEIEKMAMASKAAFKVMDSLSYPRLYRIFYDKIKDRTIEDKDEMHFQYTIEIKAPADPSKKVEEVKNVQD